MKALYRFWNWLIGANSDQEKPERQIFHFWNGFADCSADPILIYRYLESDPDFDRETHLDQAGKGDMAAWEISVKAVRRAFAVEPYDEGGLTELECLDLLGDFYTYLESLQKKTPNSASLQQSTAPTSPNLSEPTTSDMSRSGGTPGEPEPRSPTMLDAEQAQQLQELSEQQPSENFSTPTTDPSAENLNTSDTSPTTN